MFGTIGHFRVKHGQEPQIQQLLDDWMQTMRPTIPGLVVQLLGHPVDRPDVLVTVVLMRDEATYRALAENPDQDAWYRRLAGHLEADPTWEDVAWEGARLDALTQPPGHSAG